MQSIGAAALAVGSFPWLGRLAYAAEPEKRRILFFTKSAGFEHSIIKRLEPGKLSYAEQILTDLGVQKGFDVTCTKDGSIFTPEKLAAFDAFAFLTTGDLTTPGVDKQPPMPVGGKTALLDAIHGGKGFIALHTGTDTFLSPGHEKKLLYREVEKPEVDPYIQMVGGEFITHSKQQKSTLRVIDRKFPGVPEHDLTMVEEWYALKNFAPDLHVILAQETAGMVGEMYQRKPYPQTWARMHGKGRVFSTTLGHREDTWINAAYVNLMLGGIDWATGRADADVTPNLLQATPEAEIRMKAP